MTDLDLAAIRERANNATPGPWEADRIQVWGPNDESVAFVTTHDPGEGSGQPEWEANTVFIANARADIPALLDHVDTLAGEVKRVEAQRRDCFTFNESLEHRLNAVRELVNNPQTVGWIERDGVTAWVSADAIRAALDGPPPPDPDPHVPYLDN